MENILENTPQKQSRGRPKKYDIDTSNRKEYDQKRYELNKDKLKEVFKEKYIKNKDKLKEHSKNLQTKYREGYRILNELFDKNQIITSQETLEKIKLLFSGENFIQI